MTPLSSSMFTDPFSAVYKTHPGQLPSFFSIENYQTTKKPVDDLENPTPNPEPNPSLQAVDTSPKENSTQSALNPPHVFSTLLAGERDRLVRKRILSNPESASIQCLSDLPTSATQSSSALSPSKTASLNLPSTESVPFHDDHDQDDDDYIDDLSWTDSEWSDQDHDAANDDKPRNVLLKTQHQSAENITVSDNPGQNFPIPARSSIFFSPPQDLPSLYQTQNANNDRDPQRAHFDKDLKSALESGDHDTFSAVFYHAVFSGNTFIDLDNQKIHTIPDVIDLLKNHKSRLTCYQDKEREKMTSLIERMLNSSTPCASHNRQAMTRAKSAPLVSFSPHDVFTLILSNNYLNSNFSNIHQIRHLQGLQVLSLRANFLTEIPNEFGELKNLKVLNLSNNLLTFLPSSILKLKKCQFFLSGNPWLKASLSDRSGRKFQWISKPKYVFYLRSPETTPGNSPQLSIPSLMEYCIRKLCIAKDPITGEERIIDHRSSVMDQNELEEKTRFTNVYPSLANSRRPTLLPKPMKKILSNPRKNFYKCELCKNKLILNSNDQSLINGCNNQTFDQEHRNLNEFFQFQKLKQRTDHQSSHIIDPSLDHQVRVEECDNPGPNDLVPIRWIACDLNCCVINLIKD